MSCITTAIRIIVHLWATMEVMTPPQDDAPAAPGSQTLSRGLRALELLADAEKPLTITQLAAGLGVHRSNAYRILRTLEGHRFVARDASGAIRLGPKLTVLSRGVAPGLHSAARPIVTDLAYQLGMTAFLTVLDGDEVITLVTVEPSNVAATVSRNPGVRHSIGRGAPGRAIESSLTAAERLEALGSEEFNDEALEARRNGFAASRNEVIEGVSSIAAPLRLPGEPPAAVAVVHFSQPDPLTETIEAVQKAVTSITREYR